MKIAQMQFCPKFLEYLATFKLGVTHSLATVRYENQFNRQSIWLKLYSGSMKFVRVASHIF